MRATRGFLEINSAERQLSREGDSLRRRRRKRKGGESEDDAEKRASGRKEDNVRSLAPRSRTSGSSLLEILYISPRGIRALRCTALSPRNFLSVAFLNSGARWSPFTRASRGNSQEGLHFSLKNAFRVVRTARSRVTNALVVPDIGPRRIAR